MRSYCPVTTQTFTTAAEPAELLTLADKIHGTEFNAYYYRLAAINLTGINER